MRKSVLGDEERFDSELRYDSVVWFPCRVSAAKVVLPFFLG